MPVPSVALRKGEVHAARRFDRRHHLPSCRGAYPSVAAFPGGAQTIAQARSLRLLRDTVPEVADHAKRAGRCCGPVPDELLRRFGTCALCLDWSAGTISTGGGVPDRADRYFPQLVVCGLISRAIFPA